MQLYYYCTSSSIWLVPFFFPIKALFKFLIRDNIEFSRWITYFHGALAIDLHASTLKVSSSFRLLQGIYNIPPFLLRTLIKIPRWTPETPIKDAYFAQVTERYPPPFMEFRPSEIPAEFEIHRLDICHLLTGRTTSYRKIRRRWGCPGNHAAGCASCTLTGHVHHNWCLHPSHNNGVLHRLDPVFRPSWQTKGNEHQITAAQ